VHRIQFLPTIFGFKDSGVRDVPLTTDKHRILFMGDSFTEGIGVPYEKHLLQKSKQNLNRRG
jgi:hypothetical protein